MSMPRARKGPGEAEPATAASAADAAAAAASAGDAGDPPTDIGALHAAEAELEAASPGEQAGTSAAWPEGDAFLSGEPTIIEIAPGTVRMDQASATSIHATNVQAHQFAAARVIGSTVEMRQGAIGLLRGTRVRIEDGAVGAIAADSVESRDGFVFLLVARRVAGEVTVLLDWRGVAAAVGVFPVLGRLLRGRR